MSKQVFLKELTKLLKLLTKEERQKIINKYEVEIEEKLKKDKNEAKVIKAYGDLNLLATNILKEYKIDSKYINESKKSGVSENNNLSLFDNLIFTIKRISSLIDEQILRRAVEIGLYCLVFLFLLMILKIPFLIFEGLSLFMLSLFKSFIPKLFILTFKLLLNFIYFILVIYFLILIFRKINLSKVKEKSFKEKVVKDNLKGKAEPLKPPLEILTIIFQVFIVMITLPLIFILICLIIALGVFISLLIKGLMLPSILILIIALILILGSLLSMIYYLTFKKIGSNK